MGATVIFGRFAERGAPQTTVALPKVAAGWERPAREGYL
jgi:hypothetical protein